MGRDRIQGVAGGDGYTHEDPVVDEALEWFGRLREQAPDEATRRTFEAWLARNPRHAEEFRSLEALWGSTAFAAAAARLPAARDKSRRARPHASGSKFSRMLRRPAVLGAAAACLALVFWQGPALLLRWQADHMTVTGGRLAVALPDGSSMLLNSATAVAIDFAQGRRQVRLLEGEAFFDVRPDPAHPFRVAGNFGMVEVKGTAFAVRLDPREDMVVLERGRVEVALRDDPRGPVALHPGQMVFARASTFSPVASVDPEQALAWREGRIVFEDQPLSLVLAELGRYRDGVVLVMDSRANGLRVSGNYRLDDVEGAIRTLAHAAGVTMNSLPGGIILLR
ncbi:FecR family protein [Xanthobacter pseudotagetidis]|uniref:FecR family protein n=1 Tax=Xanthobacter pseudotagetidis TaxID=3119911 RepID=UPI00372CE372